MNLTLNYIGFVVSDMAAALAFYRLLGLPIPAEASATDDHFEIKVNGLRVAWDKETLIGQLDPDWTPPTQAGRVGVAFEAPTPAEVDAAVARLRSAGYIIKTEPWDAFWGQRYATVLDPDGTPIDLFAWLDGAQ